MKARNIILLIVLSIFAIENTHAQDKIGVFIHGFQGGSEKWIDESKVPRNWEGSIIDKYVPLDYETMELADETALVDKFVDEMKKKGKPATDQWILVGHSLGGIVSRVLYPAFKQAGFNIVAIISVGGPSQGAAATDVNKPFIDKRLNSMENTIKAAYEHRRWYIDFAVGFLDLVNGTSNKDRIDAIPNYIATARDSALGYADHVIENNAKDLIGLDGVLIQEINSYPKGNSSLHPQNYLSVIGAEKDKAPIRMAGQIYTGEDELKDEAKIIDNIQKLRDDYFERHEDYYDGLFNRYYTLHTSCRIRHPFRPSKCSGLYDSFIFSRHRRDLWKAAKNEIDNIDKTWSQIINSYKFTEETIRVWKSGCDPNQPQPIYYSLQEPCGVTDGYWAYETVTVATPDKNDGVVNIHSALWSKGDGLTSTHNRYFSDIPADGGYNHFELRNHKRQYDLPKSGGGYWFRKGDKNPSMEFAELWIGREL